uniref:Uncharacterized protein n=1 Tax=Macrostomum lignano TaxID=282301 RepID=A0A1I8F3V9_9PLAT
MNAFALTALAFACLTASCAAYKDPNESINECGERWCRSSGTPALTERGLRQHQRHLRAARLSRRRQRLATAGTAGPRRRQQEEQRAEHLRPWLPRLNKSNDVSSSDSQNLITNQNCSFNFAAFFCSVTKGFDLGLRLSTNLPWRLPPFRRWLTECGLRLIEEVTAACADWGGVYDSTAGLYEDKRRDAWAAELTFSHGPCQPPHPWH